MTNWKKSHNAFKAIKFHVKKYYFKWIQNTWTESVFLADSFPWRQEVEGQGRFSFDQIYLKASTASRDRLRVYELIIMQDTISEMVLFFWVMIKKLFYINLQQKSLSFYQLHLLGLINIQMKSPYPVTFRLLYLLWHMWRYAFYDMPCTGICAYAHENAHLGWGSHRKSSPSSWDVLHWLSSAAVFQNVNHANWFLDTVWRTLLWPQKQSRSQRARERKLGLGLTPSYCSGLSSYSFLQRFFIAPLWSSWFPKFIVCHQGLRRRRSNCLGIVCAN